MRFCEDAGRSDSGSGPGRGFDNRTSVRGGD